MAMLVFLSMDGLIGQTTIRAGINSDISNWSALDIPVQPTVWVYPTAKIGIGISGKYQKTDIVSSNWTISARYYLAEHCYGELDVNPTKVGDISQTGYGAVIGYTKFWKSVYFEPGIRYRHSESNDQVSIVIGIGLRL